MLTAIFEVALAGLAFIAISVPLLNIFMKAKKEMDEYEWDE
jgi:hypothetical protein